MNFRKKASALALCAVLLGTTVAPVSAATHEKLVGKDRYETAAMIADKMGDYETAILVNSDKSLSDGLSASSLSGKENAPILLAKQNKLPEATAKRLEQVKKVYIIGGEKAIGKEVEAKLAGKEVIRVAGENRIETSLEIANILGGYNKAFVVNGFKGEADAMSVAAVSAREKAPIFLTDGEDLTEYSDAKHYVIGGENMVCEEVATDLNAERIAGKDRYETNIKVLDKFYKDSNKLYFTRGDKLVDALTVSPLAKNNGVALVSEKSNKNVIKNKATLVQVGGVQDSVINQIFGGQTTEDKSSLTVASESLNVQLGEKVDYKTIGAIAKDIDGTDISDKIQIIGLNPDVPGDYFIKVVVKLSNGKELSKDLSLIHI